MRNFSLILAIFLTVSCQESAVHLAADDTANIVSKILGSFQGTSSMNLTHLFTSFDMPNCLKRCMPAMDNIGALMQTARNPEVMKEMCANLTDSSKCATAAGCNGLFVGAMANAFQFMCMDNLEKISGQFACIQDSVGDLQQECEKMCSVQADVLDNAAKNSADQLLSMEKMCNATTCLAFCYETSLPKYCDIGEDNLFDTIFSQFEALQEQPGIFGYLKKDEPKKTGVAKLLGLMMPEGCDAEKLKIKLPKNVAVPDTATPKSVGPAKKAAKLAEVEKIQKNATTVVSELAPEVLLKAKAGNLSSAAIMINGKVQTLQCQVLDSHGNSQNTPDFESLAEILATHFNKKTMGKVPTDRAEKKEEDVPKRSCRDVATRQQGSENTNSGSTIAVSALVWLIALCI